MKSSMPSTDTEAKKFVAFPDIEPSPPSSQLSTKKISLITLGIFLIGFISYQLISFLLPTIPGPISDTLTDTSPTPTPTPIVLIPDEDVKGNYVVSQSKDAKGPRIEKVTFDPLDVQVGQTLNITVHVFSKSPVSKLTGRLNSDNQASQLIFTNTTPEEPENTNWTTSLVIDDPVLFRYIVEIFGTDTNGTTTVTVAPRSN